MRSTQGNRRHPATSDQPYEADETEFMMAMESYRRSSGNNFPTWSEVLRVVKSLGYARPFQDQP